MGQSPERRNGARAETMTLVEGTTSGSKRPSTRRSRRGRRPRHVHEGFPGNPGGLVVSVESIPVGDRGTNPQARALRSGGVRERSMRSTTVSPSEGNEVRRDGRQAIGVSHSTDEAGEPPQGTL